MIAAWIISAFVLLFVLPAVALRLLLGGPTRNHPKLPPPDRHEQCLEHTAQLERELGMLSALSDAEFDAEVDRATRRVRNLNASLGPVGEEHSEQWWREKAWEIWRTQRRY